VQSRGRQITGGDQPPAQLPRGRLESPPMGREAEALALATGAAWRKCAAAPQACMWLLGTGEPPGHVRLASLNEIEAGVSFSLVA